MRIAIIALGLVAAPLAAHAQVVFPADAAYRPLRCGDAVMGDAYDDTQTAPDERDIVGDADSPAGLRASDDTHLYLRIRLDEDPAPNAKVRPYSWGMAYDLDDDATDYELLVLVEGIAGPDGTVNIFRNTATTAANDPTDPADTPPVHTYPFADNARTITAPTTFGGTADFFLDFAVPWSALVPLGLDRDTPTRVWVASSDAPNRLNGDFACHAGGGGAPTASGTASNPTTGDPNDPGADGGGTGRLEGGGGCAAGGGPGGLYAALALLALRRRRA